MSNAITSNNFVPNLGNYNQPSENISSLFGGKLHNDSTSAIVESPPFPEMIYKKDTSLDAELIFSLKGDNRQNNLTPSMIVLHHISANMSLEGVSTHYLVRSDERGLGQMVAEARRAGPDDSKWQGLDNINSRSIDIGVVVNPDEKPSNKQIKTLVALIKDVAQRNNIDLKQVVGHTDVAPGIEVDPNAALPWKTLAQNGIGIFVDPVHPSPGDVPMNSQKRDETGCVVAGIQKILGHIGYTLGNDALGHFGAATEAAVKAFQLHYRPTKADGSNGVDGIVDYSTFLTLRKLAAKDSGCRSIDG